MKTIDVSGMGGGYENECQKMLKAGMEFLDKNPGPITYKEYKQIYGVIDTSDSERAGKLQDHIVKASGDCTGAMVQCCMGHLAYIAKHGRLKWLAEFTATPDRMFDWDGTKESCPQTEMSQKMDGGPQ